MRSRSVVPPMPREVSSDRFAAGWSSTPSSAKLASNWGSLMRMFGGMLRSEKNHEFVAGAADAACADSQNRVAGARLLEQELDAFLKQMGVVDVLVAGIANGVGKGFTGHAGDGRFAGGIDIGQHEDVGLIESAAEFVPEVLRAREAVRLEKHKQTVELAAAGGFELGANFCGVMAV